MLVALLNTKDTLRARYLLECMEAGIRSCGDDTVWVGDYRDYRRHLEKADVGLQVCYPNLHKSTDAKTEALGQFRVNVNDLMHDLGKRIITIDTGFVRNQSDYELQVAASDRRHKVLFDIDNKSTYEAVLKDIYYEIGYDGLKRQAAYYADNVPGDRWAELGIELKPWRTGGDYVLLVGQTLFGLSSQKVNIYDWYRKAIKRIRMADPRVKIVFRHHPRLVKIRAEGSRLDKDRKAVLGAIGRPENFAWSEGWTMADDLKRAMAAVIYTSNAAVQSAISGVPTFVGSPTCMADPVAGRLDKGTIDLKRPATPDRTQWANSLAYSQFSCAEMLAGVPWQHLRPYANHPPTRNWRDDN